MSRHLIERLRRSGLLDPRVVRDHLDGGSVRDRFREAITGEYISQLESLEKLARTESREEEGSKSRGADSRFARRIGVNVAQVARWRLPGIRPSLEVFCLRSAAEDAEFPRGALVAFKAYAQAYRLVAALIGKGAASISAEQACCLYFSWRLWIERAKGGNSGPFNEAEIQDVLRMMEEYLGDAAFAVSGDRDRLIRTPCDVRDTLKGRIEIWINTVFAVGIATSEWYTSEEESGNE